MNKLVKKKLSFTDKLFRKSEIFFEKIKGVDFSIVKNVNELGLDPKFVSKGSPSGNKYLLDVFSDLNIKNTDSILDVGCAKGSALFYLSKFDFEKVDGIEISNELASIAKKNFKVLNKRINIFNEDAQYYKNYSKYNYFYFYNPFPNEIMSIVLQNIIQQHEKAKLSRSINIIYNHPLCHQQLIENKFKFIKTYQDAWGNGINYYILNIY